MARTCDSLVLGAGVGACATALALRKATREEVWLVVPTWIGDDPSTLSPALLHAYHEMAALSDLSAPAPVSYRRWAQESEMDLGFQQPGMLVVADPDLADRVVGRGNRLRARGVRTESLDEDQMAGLEPRGLFPAGGRGLLLPDASILDGRRTVEALARLAAREGVRVIQGESPRALIAQGDRVLGVQTTHGAIHSPWTVLAADSLVWNFLPELAKRALVAVDRPYQLLQPAPEFGTPGPILWHERSGHTWRGLGNGWIRRNGPGPEERADPLLPALERATMWGSGVWHSYLGADRRPLVGPAPGKEGLLLACGYGPRDFDLAPVTGRFLVSWVARTEHPEGLAAVLDPRRYTPAGFAPPLES
jgi:glycine/D-amino acid oxidase-like deaminating enzyme